MKKILTTLFLLVCCLGLSWADGPFRVARYDGFKVLSPKAGSIVMIGNSITDMHIWQEVFRDANGNYLPICGRGNSGSYSTEQSENIESYIANGPSKVFMMIGTNDIATSGGLNFTPEQVLSYVKSIVNRIHRRSPQTHIYLYPILNNNTYNRVKATWLQYNQILQDYINNANDELLTFVDIYDELSDVASGGAWSNDNLHPNAAAYKKWCHAILPYLGENVTSVYDNIDGDLTDVQRQDGLGSMTGGRATMFSVMPISNNDIMIFGDSEIKTAEWWELLGNANVKNRGTGWNNTGDIATTSKEVDATWASTGADKSGCPKAIFVYTGTSDVTNNEIDMETVQSDYSALISKLKTKAPSAKIYVMAIHPRYNNESLNTGRITTFNNWLQNTLAAGDAAVRFVDTYTPLLNGNNADGAYINGNQYLLGKGSVLFANAMAAAYNADFDTDKMDPVTVEQGNTNYAMSTRRNNIGTAITEGRDIVAGTKVGDYTEAGVNAFHEAETAAFNVLAQETITDAEATSTVNALKAGLEVIAPTKENTAGKYFRIYAPNRGTRYLTGNGSGNTMSGLSLDVYDNQVWLLEGRNDGTFDVKNVYDGSYMAMTSPITTTVAKPANGWTFGNSNTTGLFIITSGTNQLNQQNNSPYNILNWGGGSNTNDDGCKYKIVEVEESDFQHLTVQNGKYYTIAGYVINNTKQTTHYVLYDGTTRSMSTSVPSNNDGVWKAVKVDGGWKFQSVKDKTQYLTFDGTDGTGAKYTIEDGVAGGCVSMKINGVWSASSETGEMGGAYKSSKNPVQNSYNWSTDWKIQETEPMYIKEGQLYTIAGYVARNGGTTNYVYYDGTTRSMSTTAPMDFSGVWKAVKSEGMWKFKAAASKGKYLTYDGVNDTGAFYTIEEGVSDGSLSMKIDGVWSASSETGDMGGAYKASSGTVQSDSYGWATDWIFTEYEATATGLSLTTTATALVKKSGWVTGLVGTTNNQWSLPTTAAIVADLGEANTPSTGFYWGMGNGQNLNSNNDLNGLSSTAFNMVARQAYTGTYAAQVYVTDKVIREINVGFSAGGNLTRTSFSIWKLEGSTATCLAQSASSALAQGEQCYSAKDLYLPVGSRLILIWNANNAGQTLNITNFNATYVEAEDIEELDEVTYIVEKASGCLLKDNSTPNQTWNNTWKNYSPAQLIFSCPANNMTWNGNKIDLYTGQTTTSTYTISAPESFTIKSYSFILKNNGHDTAINLTIDGKNYTTSSSAQTFSKSDVNEKAVSFTLSGPNGNGVTIDEFTVTVERDNTPDPLQKFITMPTLSTSAIPYRIPAIGQAYNGDVIAVADYRYSRADIGMATNGKIDLRYRVKDHATGEWGEIMTLAAAEGTDAMGKYATSQEDSLHFAYGDPCIVCDINSSDVVVTSCSGNVSFPNGTRNNHQGWAYFLSHDNGQTWEPVKDISRQIFTQFDKREGSIRCMFIGSGKICQSTTVKVGTHNRLYCAALVKLGDGSNTAWSLYSDDFGHTWNVLGGVQNIPITGADEPKSEELPDGSILLSTRIASGRKYNIYHFTDIATGEGYWETAQTVTNTKNGYTASSNACNGETLCVPVTKKADNSKVFLLLQSVPFGPTGRTNVGINYKELTDFNDFRLPSMLKADSWDGKYQVSSIGSAYSTMCLGQNGEIHFLYEEETYCGTGGGGYSIVYKNIPVEIMTNDAYEYRTPTNEDLVAYLQAGFTPYYNTIAITGVGDYVGQITTAGKDVLDNAKDAYIQNPTHANYNVYNATYITTDRVALKTNQHYRIMNRSRGGIRAYSISLGQGKMVGAATDENSLEQHFRVVPVQGTSDQWYLQNATNGEYFGKLGANETESTNVTETADAGIWVINSNINGISTFYNTNKTGSNSYIHLANGNVRLVPWTDSEASQWYILPIDYAAERSDESTDIDIVITGTVSSAAEVAALVEEVSATVDMTKAKINVTVDDDFVEVIKDQTKNPNTILYVTTDATVTSGTSNVVVDGVCDKLVLSDSNDKNVSIPSAFSATSAKYTRGGEETPTMITKNRYATIFMPYAFSTEGLKVMQFKSFAEGVLTFEEVENPEPNVPYLIRQADDSDEPSVKIMATGTNVTVETTSAAMGTDAEFLGTYTPLTLYATSDGYDYYGYSSINGDFRKVSTTGNPCYPFRAYFRMPHTDDARQNLSVVYGEFGEVTRIDNIVETGANAQPIYNLNGTRVNNVEKGGIYIQGGRKIVTK